MKHLDQRENSISVIANYKQKIRWINLWNFAGSDFITFTWKHEEQNKLFSSSYVEARHKVTQYSKTLKPLGRRWNFGVSINSSHFAFCEATSKTSSKLKALSTLRRDSCEVCEEKLRSCEIFACGAKS